MNSSSKKIFRNGFISKFLLIIGLLCLFIFLNAFSYVSAVSADISSSVFRLHVIANSDTDEDQALKYKVRDALLEYMNSICKDVPSKQEAMDIANSHIDNFYPVNITLGKSDFPTKNYGDVSLPAGTYDALRVEIGSASGRNWWCVMFPPLCFVDVSSGVVPDSSKELLQNNMSEEDYDLITDDNSSSELTFKFKLVELFENWRLQLASK